MSGQLDSSSGKAIAERESLDKFVRERDVEGQVQDIVQSLLAAKPENPRQWLLNKLEQELSDESEDLAESDLHKLFSVARKISSEIVPQNTIDIVIAETLDLLHCDTVSLFVLDKKSGMLRLFASNLENPIMVSPGQGIAGAVFNSGESVNIPDCYKDRRFDRTFDRKSGYVTRSILVVPIMEFDESTIGVIQAINKMPKGTSRGPTTDDKGQPSPAGLRAVPFSRNDEKILSHLCQHVGIALRNAEVFREAINTSERVTGLLNTIQSLSQDLGTQSLLLTITMHANKIVSAVRSTVFLHDDANQQLWSVSTDTGAEIRIPNKAGIAGLCYSSGNLINIPDAYADSRFNQEVDKRLGFKTQSILAIPMFEEQGHAHSMQPRKSSAANNGPLVIGVIQMINKQSFDGQLEAFDDADIEVMEMFAKFVGPKLTNSSMLIRRHSESLEVSEGARALGKSSQLGDPSETKEDRARKRLSMQNHDAALPELNEAEEEEEEESAGAAA